MKRVTDPSLLSQLETGAGQPRKVTDPSVLAQLDGTGAPAAVQPTARPGLMNVLADPSKFGEAIGMGPRASAVLNAVTQNPLMRANEQASRLFNRAGQGAAESMASHGINPNAAAAIGTGIQMLPDIAGTIAGAGATTAAGPARQATGFLQRLGARGVNNAAGITPKTLMKIAGNENPATVGTRLGTKMVQDNAVGMGPASTFDKTQSVLNRYGEDVEKALSDIRTTGQSTTVSADDALQPLYEKWAELKSATYGTDRALARTVRDAYEKLSAVARQNDGQLDLNELRKVMQETGSAMSRAAIDSPKHNALSEIYGVLAKSRDAMVEKIADSAGNPALAQRLKEANAGYSLYSRISSDVERAAAKQAVSGVSLFEPVKSAIRGIQPLLSRAAVKIGQPTGGAARIGKTLGITSDDVVPEQVPARSVPLTVAGANEGAEQVNNQTRRLFERVTGLGPPPIPKRGTALFTKPSPQPRPLNLNRKPVAKVVGPKERDRRYKKAS